MGDFKEDEVETKSGNLKLLGKGLQKLRYLKVFWLDENTHFIFFRLIVFRCQTINDKSLNQFGKQMAKSLALRSLTLGFG